MHLFINNFYRVDLAFPSRMSFILDVYKNYIHLLC